MGIIFSMTNEEVTKQLSEVSKLKPDDLIMGALQWKYLVWAVIRGKNILFIGPTRSGKTKAAKSVAEIFCEFKTETLNDDELLKLKSDASIKITGIEKILD